MSEAVPAHQPRSEDDPGKEVAPVALTSVQRDLSRRTIPVLFSKARSSRRLAKSGNCCAGRSC